MRVKLACWVSVSILSKGFFERHVRWVSLLLLAFGLPGVVWAQVTNDVLVAKRQPSVVEIPLRLSLDRLKQVAEGKVPLQAGNPHRWQAVYGIRTRYQAWRGPLSISMVGEELWVQAHVRYWLQARRHLVSGLTLKSSCGVKEPPRQAIIGLRIRLDWREDWTLWPTFRLMPTRFLDECEMTLANIDVTPLVGHEFRRQLKDRMYEALETLAPVFATIRERAAANWSGLQQPIAMGGDNWLLLNPGAVALSPLVGSGDSVDTRLALVMQPFITDMPASHRAVPLPPLMRFYPQSSGINLRVDLAVDFADLGQAMSEGLSGQTFRFQGHSATVESLSLEGQGEQVTARVRLGGDLAGEVVIKAGLAFGGAEEPLLLTNLSYTATLDDIWLESDAKLFYNQVRHRLEDRLNRQIRSKTLQWKTALLAALEGFAPDDTRLDASTLKLSHATFRLGEDRVILNGTMSGYIYLE